MLNRKTKNNKTHKKRIREKQKLWFDQIVTMQSKNFKSWLELFTLEAMYNYLICTKTQNYGAMMFAHPIAVKRNHVFWIPGPRRREKWIDFQSRRGRACECRLREGRSTKITAWIALSRFLSDSWIFVCSLHRTYNPPNKSFQTVHYSTPPHLC